MDQLRNTYRLEGRRFGFHPATKWDAFPPQSRATDALQRHKVVPLRPIHTPTVCHLATSTANRRTPDHLPPRFPQTAYPQLSNLAADVHVLQARTPGRAFSRNFSRGERVWTYRKTSTFHLLRSQCLGILEAEFRLSEKLPDASLSLAKC